MNDGVNVEMTAQQHFEEELGVIAYSELQKHFAKGIVLMAAEGLDLVQVALSIHQDDADRVQHWVDNELLVRANDDHAKAWLKSRAVFKAVTVAPWVLVQEVDIPKEDVIAYMKENEQ